MKILLRALAAVVMTLSLVVVSSPAQATTGGGCQNTTAIRACISYSGGYVHSDFYLIQPADFSRCYVYLRVMVNGSQSGAAVRYTLNAQTRYGPVSRSVATIPPSNGNARTRVDVYRCDNVFHYTAYSPYVYYP